MNYNWIEELPARPVDIRGLMKNIDTRLQGNNKDLDCKEGENNSIKKDKEILKIKCK